MMMEMDQKSVPALTTDQAAVESYQEPPVITVAEPSAEMVPEDAGDEARENDDGDESRTMQILVVAILNLAQFNIGIGVGYSAIAGPSLQDESFKIKATDNQVALFAALLCVGQIVGSLTSIPLSSKLGRKITVICSCTPGIAGWLMQGLAFNFSVILAGRFLVGASMGMEGAIHAMYVCELTSAKLRGPLASSGVVVITTGILIVYVPGSLLNFQVVAIVAAIAPASAMILASFVLPESPVWLVRNGSYEKADKVIAWLKRDEAKFTREIENELRQKIVAHSQGRIQEDGIGQNGPRINYIGKQYSTERSQEDSSEVTKWNDLRLDLKSKFERFKTAVSDPETMKTLGILCFLFFVQAWSGSIAIIFYAVSILQDAISSFNAYYGTIFIGIIHVLGTMIGTVLMNKFGRKPLLIISLSVCLVTMTGLGAFTFFMDRELRKSSSLQWLSLTCTILFILGQTMGLSPVPWVLVGELLPVNSRSTVAGVATSVCYLSIFTAAFTFPLLSHESVLNNYGTFWLYGIIAALGLIFTLVFVSETRPTSSSSGEHDDDGPTMTAGNIALKKLANLKRLITVKQTETTPGAAVGRRTSSVFDAIAAIHNNPADQIYVRTNDDLFQPPLEPKGSSDTLDQMIMIGNDNLGFERTIFDPEVGYNEVGHFANRFPMKRSPVPDEKTKKKENDYNVKREEIPMKYIDDDGEDKNRRVADDEKGAAFAARTAAKAETATSNG